MGARPLNLRLLSLRPVSFRPFMLRLAAVIVVALSLCVFVGAVQGAEPTAATAAVGTSGEQSAGAAPPELLQAFSGTLSPSQIDEILAVLEDQQVREVMREMLIREYGAAQAEVDEPNRLEIYRARFAELSAAAATLPADIGAALHTPNSEGVPGNPGRLFGSIAGLILLGCIAYWITQRALRQTRDRIDQSSGASLGRRVGRAIGHILFDAAEIVAFAVAIVIGYLILSPSDPRAPEILMLLLRAGIIVLIVVKTADFVLRPSASDARPLPLGDAAALRIFRIVIGIVVLVVVAVGFVRLLGVLGLPDPSGDVAGMIVTAVIIGLMIALAWIYRRPVQNAIRRRAGGVAKLGPMASAWPIIATIVGIGLWLFTADALIMEQEKIAPRFFGSLVIVALVPLLAFYAGRSLRRFYGLDEEDAAAPITAVGDEISDGETVEGDEETAQVAATRAEESAVVHGGFVRLAGAVWATVIIIGLFALARLWGVDLEEEAGIGATAARVVFHAGAIVLISYVIYELIRTAIDRRVRMATRSGAGSQAKRLSTLLPLLQKFVSIVLLVMVALVILSSLGIEIGPLLAGAGVIGLAIGLGAQSLVTDIVAGIFFLIDDAFAVGDYVEMGQLRGTVESISIRSLKLRHHRGAVHTVPFGQMKSLTNYSRDWVIMKMEFRVHPDTDLGVVKKIVKRIGTDLLADPVLGPGFIEPLKSQGVRRIEDDALIIGVKFMSKPGEQFMIRKEAYQRIRDAFAAADIPFAARGVAVRVDPLAGASPEAVTAAAAEAVEQMQPTQQPASQTP